jgi:hypothetical protein
LEEENNLKSIKIKKEVSKSNKISNSSRNEIDKVRNSYEKKLQIIEDNHLDVISIVNNTNKSTIHKLTGDIKQMKENNENLHKMNYSFMETIKTYSTNIEAYLQRNILGIDINNNTLKMCIFSEMKRDALIQLLGMVDIQYRRMMQMLNYSSVLVNEVKCNVFLRHFHEVIEKMLEEVDDKDITESIKPYSDFYKLKRLFILGRFNFNVFIEIITTFIPREI